MNTCPQYKIIVLILKYELLFGNFKFMWANYDVCVFGMFPGWWEWQAAMVLTKSILVYKVWAANNSYQCYSYTAQGCIIVALT